jgi:hypothetical protein
MELEDKQKEFFRAIAPCANLYSPAFTYVVVKQGGIFVLVHGIVTLSAVPPRGSSEFNSPDALAGHFSLAELNCGDLPPFLTMIGSGTISLPNGEVAFIQSNIGGYRSFYSPLRAFSCHVGLECANTDLSLSVRSCHE